MGTWGLRTGPYVVSMKLEDLEVVKEFCKIVCFMSVCARNLSIVLEFKV